MNAMWTWIANHHDVINAVTNVAMLLVWVAYLQVFVSSYRRQKRSNILINRGAGTGLEARCLISNMSAEAIYIESVIASIETKQGRWTYPVTETQAGRSDLELATRQGPLEAGRFIDIGTFRSMIQPALEGSLRGAAVGADDPRDLVALEIKVIAVHGSEDLLAGAVRRFDVIGQNDEITLRGHTVGTYQIRSRRKREALRSEVEADL